MRPEDIASPDHAHQPIIAHEATDCPELTAYGEGGGVGSHHLVISCGNRLINALTGVGISPRRAETVGTHLFLLDLLRRTANQESYKTYESKAAKCTRDLARTKAWIISGVCGVSELLEEIAS